MTRRNQPHSVVRLKCISSPFDLLIKITVKADYFPHMKEAIKAMLHEMLEMKFDSRDEDAWDEVLTVLITDMTKAQREVAMKREVDKHKARK